MSENTNLNTEVTEGTISISPKMKMTKRTAINICEQIIQRCGTLNNYSRVSTKMIQFSCTVIPEKIMLFIRELDRNFIINVNRLNRSIDGDIEKLPYNFKLFLTIPEKV